MEKVMKKIIVQQAHIPSGESFEIEAIELMINDLLEEVHSFGTVAGRNVVMKPPDE